MQDSHGIAFDLSSVYCAGPYYQWLAAKDKDATFMDVPVTSTKTIRSFPRIKSALDSEQWQSGRLDTALSLALMESEDVDGINFSSEQSTIQFFWSEHKGRLIATAALILITFAVVLTGQVLSVQGKKKQLAELDRQIEAVFKRTFPEVTRVVNPLQQMQIKIKEISESSVRPDLPGSRVRAVDILDALSRQIPKAVDVKVHRMVMGTENVVLSGNTDTFNTVDEIKGRLEEADIFNSVTISSADLEKSGKRIRFKLKMEF